MKLEKSRVVITGASQGFGAELAKCFLQEGASLVICARDPETLRKKRDELQSFVKPGAELIAIPADVSQADSVQQLIATAEKKLGGIDVLVLNAGVYGPKGPIESIDWDEWSRAIDINLKGVVLPCRAVVPLMKQNRHGKIIFLSGGGATKPLPFLSAYAASKAAVVRFAESLALELKEYNIDVNSVAPGALNTRLLDEILDAGAEKVGQAFYQQSLKQKEEGGAPLAIGAALCTYLASGESDGITGRLLSAQWDPWANLQTHQAALKDSDVYTLRRIIPEDRDLEWN